MARRTEVQVIRRGTRSLSQSPGVMEVVAALENETHDNDVFEQRNRLHQVKEQTLAELRQLERQLEAVNGKDAFAFQESTDANWLRTMQSKVLELRTRLDACRILDRRLSLKAVGSKIEIHSRFPVPLMEEVMIRIEAKIADVTDPEERRQRLIELKTSIDMQVQPLRNELRRIKSRAITHREFADPELFAKANADVIRLGMESQTCQILLGRLKPKVVAQEPLPRSDGYQIPREEVILNHHFVAVARGYLEAEIFQEIEETARNQATHAGPDDSFIGKALAEKRAALEAARPHAGPSKPRVASRFLSEARLLRTGSEENGAKIGALIAVFTHDDGDLMSMKMRWENALQGSSRVLDFVGNMYVRSLLARDQVLDARAVYEAVPSGARAKGIIATLLAAYTRDTDLMRDARTFAQRQFRENKNSRVYRQLVGHLNEEADLEEFEALALSAMKELDSKSLSFVFLDHVHMTLGLQLTDRARQQVSQVMDPALKAWAAALIAAHTREEADGEVLHNVLGSLDPAGLRVSMVSDLVRGLLNVGSHQILRALIAALDEPRGILAASIAASHLNESVEGRVLGTTYLATALERFGSIQDVDVRYSQAGKELVRALAAYGRLNDAEALVSTITQQEEKCIAYLMLHSVYKKGPARLVWEGDERA